MVNTEPLKNYIESRDALRTGDKKRALSLLVNSIGAKTPTPYMESYLDKLTEPNQAILTLILHESKGAQDG